MTPRLRLRLLFLFLLPPPKTKGDDHSEILRLGRESLNDRMQVLLMVLGEGGSTSMGLGGANTAFSITSVRLRVLHDPNEDRNMREIRSLRRFWFSMANSEWLRRYYLLLQRVRGLWGETREGRWYKCMRNRNQREVLFQIKGKLFLIIKCTDATLCCFFSSSSLSSLRHWVDQWLMREFWFSLINTCNSCNWPWTLTWPPGLRLPSFYFFGKTKLTSVTYIMYSIINQR